MGDRYGLGLMVFYVFTDLVLGIMLRLNFGTSQRRVFAVSNSLAVSSIFSAVTSRA